MRARAAVVLALAPALAPAACSPDFDDVTTVKDLRVLAVVANPPEFVVDPNALPDDFGPVKLRPLIVDPNGGGRPVHVRAVVCGNGTPTTQRGRNMGPGTVRDSVARGACPDDSPVIAELAATPDAVEVQFTPTRALVLDAFMADPFAALFGLPLSVQLTVSAGGQQVVVRKRVIFTPRLTPDQTPNRNPVIPAVTWRVNQEDAPTAFALYAPDAAPPAVPLDGKLRITPRPEDPLESYPAIVLDRETQRPKLQQIARETLRYAFFATAGTFSPPVTTTEPQPLRSTPGDPLTVVYRAPRTPPGTPDGHVDVWVVARDERGGESFLRLAVRAGP